MPIENFAGISIAGLDINNPAGTDPGSDLDNHVRGQKTVLKFTFPNFTVAGQVTSTQAELNHPILKTTVAADKVPYYTGTTTASTFDISAFGRSMAATANWSTALALLGTDARYVPINTAFAGNISATGTIQAGAFTLVSAAPTITFADTTWANRSLHMNDGLMGFLNNTGGWSFHNDNAGNTTTPGTAYAGEFYLTSDPRLKTNIKPISAEAATAFVRNVKGYTYKMKESGKLTSGVLSTEVAAVVPALVNTHDDGFDRVNYDAIIPYTLVALNAAIERLDLLSIENERLRIEIARFLHQSQVNSEPGAAI